MCLFANCDHLQSKGMATVADVECGNAQLCAGLPSGIEANLHAVSAIWPESAGWTQDDGIEDESDEDDVMPAEDGLARARSEEHSTS